MLVVSRDGRFVAGWRRRSAEAEAVVGALEDAGLDVAEVALVLRAVDGYEGSRRRVPVAWRRNVVSTRRRRMGPHLARIGRRVLDGFLRRFGR